MAPIDNPGDAKQLARALVRDALTYAEDSVVAWFKGTASPAGLIEHAREAARIYDQRVSARVRVLRLFPEAFKEGLREVERLLSLPAPPLPAALLVAIGLASMAERDNASTGATRGQGLAATYRFEQGTLFVDRNLLVFEKPGADGAPPIQRDFPVAELTEVHVRAGRSPAELCITMGYTEERFTMGVEDAVRGATVLLPALVPRQTQS